VSGSDVRPGDRLREPLPRPIITLPVPTTPVSGDFPAGPSQAPTCTSVTITPGQDAAAMMDEYPAGSAFCFAAGLNRIEHTIRPEANSTLAGDDGAVLTGSVPLINRSADGGDWVTKGRAARRLRPRPAPSY
jgi:hypothetical protein